jgi:hypothetical protein
VFLGIPLVLHEALLSEKDEAEFLDKVLTTVAAEKNAVHRFHFLEFLTAWMKRGKPLSAKCLETMNAFISNLPETPARAACLAELDKSVNYFSPILGR